MIRLFLILILLSGGTYSEEALPGESLFSILINYLTPSPDPSLPIPLPSSSPTLSPVIPTSTPTVISPPHDSTVIPVPEPTIPFTPTEQTDNFTDSGPAIPPTDPTKSPWMITWIITFIALIALSMFIVIGKSRLCIKKSSVSPEPIDPELAQGPKELISSSPIFIRGQRIGGSIDLFRLDETKELGSSQFSRVVEGSLESQKVAIKILNLQFKKYLEDEVMAHIATLKIINEDPKYQDVVVRLIAVNVDLGCLITELVPGQNLKKYINGRTVPLTQKIRSINEICRALIAVHEANFVHADLCATNVLVQETEHKKFRVKLSDFGCARVRDTLVAGNIDRPIGKETRLPPEIILGKEKEFKPSLDAWAFGLFIWELLTDCESEPFLTADTSMWGFFSLMVSNEDQPIHSLAHLFDKSRSHEEIQLIDVIDKCLCLDPLMRCSMLAVRHNRIIASANR